MLADSRLLAYSHHETGLPPRDRCHKTAKVHRSQVQNTMRELGSPMRRPAQEVEELIEKM